MTKNQKQCVGCKWLHAGIKVDHNHCDLPTEYGHRYIHEERANGKTDSGTCRQYGQSNLGLTKATESSTMKT